MNIVVSISSARDLKNVNWRHGSLRAYAAAWIDSGAKCSTETDWNNGVNPVWDEKLTIALPSASDPETAVLYVDILQANTASGTKPLVGSAKLPLRTALDQFANAPKKRKARFDLILERPSGRPQGSLKIKIKVKESSSSTAKKEPKEQMANNARPRSQPQPQPQPHPQPQPQPQYYQYYPNASSNPYMAGYPPYAQPARPNTVPAPAGYANSVEDIEGTSRASEALDAAYAKARMQARGRMYALNLI